MFPYTGSASDSANDRGDIYWNYQHKEHWWREWQRLVWRFRRNVSERHYEEFINAVQQSLWHFVTPAEFLDNRVPVTLGSLISSTSLPTHHDLCSQFSGMNAEQEGFSEEKAKSLTLYMVEDSEKCLPEALRSPVTYPKRRDLARKRPNSKNLELWPWSIFGWQHAFLHFATWLSRYSTISSLLSSSWAFTSLKNRTSLYAENEKAPQQAVQESRIGAKYEWEIRGLLIAIDKTLSKGQSNSGGWYFSNIVYVFVGIFWIFESIEILSKWKLSHWIINYCSHFQQPQQLETLTRSESTNSTMIISIMMSESSSRKRVLLSRKRDDSRERNLPANSMWRFPSLFSSI